MRSIPEGHAAKPVRVERLLCSDDLGGEHIDYYDFIGGRIIFVPRSGIVFARSRNSIGRLLEVARVAGFLRFRGIVGIPLPGVYEYVWQKI